MLESYINILIHLNCSSTKCSLYSCMQKTGSYVSETLIGLLWDNFCRNYFVFFFQMTFGSAVMHCW